MFLISEVHPFLDGNGRMTGFMTNTKLLKQGQSKIIIPTVYRDDDMTALTHQQPFLNGKEFLDKLGIKFPICQETSLIMQHGTSQHQRAPAELANQSPSTKQGGA